MWIILPLRRKYFRITLRTAAYSFEHGVSEVQSASEV